MRVRALSPRSCSEPARPRMACRYRTSPGSTWGGWQGRARALAQRLQRSCTRMRRSRLLALRQAAGSAPGLPAQQQQPAPPSTPRSAAGCLQSPPHNSLPSVPTPPPTARLPASTATPDTTATTSAHLDLWQGVCNLGHCKVGALACCVPALLQRVRRRGHRRQQLAQLLHGRQAAAAQAGSAGQRMEPSCAVRRATAAAWNWPRGDQPPARSGSQRLAEACAAAA